MTWWLVWGWHGNSRTAVPEVIAASPDRAGAKRLALEIAYGRRPGWYVNIYLKGFDPKELVLYNIRGEAIQWRNPGTRWDS